jgi:hypothetical protein
MGWDGTGWHTMGWNGMEQNGMEWNGAERDGMEWEEEINKITQKGSKRFNLGTASCGRR